MATATTTTAVPHVYTALGEVMRAIEALGKDQRNPQQGFQYRGIDDAYNALHKLMAAAGLVCFPCVEDMVRETKVSGRGTELRYTILKVNYLFVSTVDGSSARVGPTVGEGMDAGDKSAAKALAIAHKYALLQTFMIPTKDMPDPDSETFDVRAADGGVATPPQLFALQTHIANGTITMGQVMKAFNVPTLETLTYGQAKTILDGLAQKSAQRN